MESLIYCYLVPSIMEAFHFRRFTRIFWRRSSQKFRKCC